MIDPPNSCQSWAFSQLRRFELSEQFALAARLSGIFKLACSLAGKILLHLQS